MSSKKNKLRVRVFIVDDSADFRSTLAQSLSSMSGIEVVGEAADFSEARDKISGLKPDVLVADIAVPLTNARFAEQYSVPCIAISGTVSEKIAADAGAADFLRKPRSAAEFKTFATVLGTKIILAAGKPVRKAVKPSAQNKEKSDSIISPIEPLEPFEPAVKTGKVTPNFPSKDEISGLSQKASAGLVVALGASTGGTDALESILKVFPATMPPVLVVQHMPPVFTKMYSERLDKCCAMTIKEAEDGDRLRQGLCLIAAGGLHMELKRDARGYYVKCYEGEKVSGHCPSVDVMFTSVAEVAGNNAVGALMTGMGADGAKGLLKMHQKGAHTIGQDKESCVVYGMPMEAYKLGACDEQVTLADIGRIICKRITERK